MHQVPPHEITEALRQRLLDLWERTGEDGLRRLAQGEPPREGAAFEAPQERSDWISTCLMEAYKNTGDAAVFALLFELNQQAFLVAVHGHLRRTSLHIDPSDVLQEVFLNIYRYPHRFLSDRADAFRNWGHRIVRNTLLKFLRGENKVQRQRSLDDEFQCEDAKARSPLRAASDGEGAQLVNRAYVLWLNLYLLHFAKLSAKEQKALTMVEVEGRSYRDAAAELGIRLENLKMVIFRGRRKILRGMNETLAALAAAHRPDAQPEADRHSASRRPAEGRQTVRRPTSSNIRPRASAAEPAQLDACE